MIEKYRYREGTVRIYRTDNMIAFSPAQHQWIREQRREDPSFNVCWQYIDYDEYMRNITKFKDSCGPIDDYHYVTRKKRAYEAKKKKKAKKKATAELRARKEKRREAERLVAEGKRQEQIRKNLATRKPFTPIPYPLHTQTKYSLENYAELERTNIPYDETQEFYETPAWKNARDKYMSQQPKPFQCHKCGRSPDPNYKKAPIKMGRSEREKQQLEREWNQNRIVVDHILPVKYFWNLKLEPDNFQLLCGCCNKEKLNTINWDDLKEQKIKAKQRRESKKMGVMEIRKK